MNINDPQSFPKLKFRAWSTKEKRFLAEGFHMIGECTLFDILNQHALEELDTLIVTQYITQQDCDGIELYCGDIIQCDNMVAPISWAGYLWSAKPRNGSNIFIWYEYPDIKKIGNIFENPELLN